MPTRVFEYGALAPIVNADVVKDQMWLAHRYRNALIELEHKRREATQQTLLGHEDTAALSAEVTGLAEEIEALFRRAGKIRQEAHLESKRAQLPPELKPLVAEKKLALKEKRAALKAAKAKVKADADVQSRLAKIDEDAQVARRALRAASGVYWGTYLPVEAAVDQARKTALVAPKFMRWTGRGHVAVQIQSQSGEEPFQTSNIFRENTLVWIEAVDPAAWEKGQSGRRRAMRTKLHMRVQSEQTKPVWAVVPIVMHRPLPPGVVKWVHLFREPTANSNRWRVQIVVDMKEPSAPQASAAPSTAGIDVGWRAFPDGSIRVASLVGDDGLCEELRLPAKLVAKSQHPNDLRAVRDKILNEMKPPVLEWLKTTSEDLGSELSWQHADKWRSPGKFIRLLRLHGDKMPQDLKEHLEQYRRRDLHLWQWEVFERRKFLFQRRELFRLWAAKLAAKYKLVGLEAFDLSTFSRFAPAEEKPKSDGRIVRANKAVACASGLRLVIRSAVEGRGGRVVEVPAHNTTKQCAFCAQTDDWDAANVLTHSCSACGRSWDQDENAARNVLARTMLTPIVASGENQTSAWQRRKSKKQTGVEKPA